MITLPRLLCWLGVPTFVTATALGTDTLVQVCASCHQIRGGRRHG